MNKKQRPNNPTPPIPPFAIERMLLRDLIDVVQQATSTGPYSGNGEYLEMKRFTEGQNEQTKRTNESIRKHNAFVAEQKALHPAKAKEYDEYMMQEENLLAVPDPPLPFFEQTKEYFRIAPVITSVVTLVIIAIVISALCHLPK